MCVCVCVCSCILYACVWVVWVCKRDWLWKFMFVTAINAMKEIIYNIFNSLNKNKLATQEVDFKVSIVNNC